MALSRSRLLPILTVVAMLLANDLCQARLLLEDGRQVYIVFLDSSVWSKFTHLDILSKVLEGSTPEEVHIYSYVSFNAFSARLTEKEVDKLRRLPGVLAVIKSVTYHIDGDQVAGVGPATIEGSRDLV